MKKAFLFLVFCLFSTALSAQKQGQMLIDSLETALKNTKDKKTIVIIKNKLSQEYSRVDPEKGKQLAKSAIEMAETIDFKNIDKVPGLNVNINKWIYSELIETKNKIEKNLEDYRFDEAAKNAYQFAWHSYCDWYLELSKTILFSEDEKAKAEVKKVSSFVFKQILILLHPFIPFVTEEIWLKNKFDNDGSDYLMLKNWLSGEINKDSSTEQVENIINIISEIRSFKNELNVSPGSFIDVSISNINKNQKDFINTNEIILKKLGRINSILDKDLDKPAATMVVSGDLFKIYFDKDVDLKLIKENLTNKQSRLEQEMNKISQRLENKSFVDRAPKEIVEQEKNNYNNLKNDIEKISVTIKGI